MKSWIVICIMSVIIILTGCSSNQNIKIESTEELFFAEDKELPFEIKVTEDGKAVKNLKILAVFSMLDMDHGTYEVPFEEGKDGHYFSKMNLPMAGDWEAVYSIERDGDTFEKVVTYKVEKKSGVASVNGEMITTDDIEFYRFINKLHIAISRVQDEERYSGKELEDALAYWDSQEKLNENQNQLLTQIIRLRAMALLGKEKGHTASPDEVKNAINTVRGQYAEHEIAQEMIQEYGENKFWSTEENQYKMIILSQKVQQDLISDVKGENPKVNDQEISYLAQKKYEELLVSQINSLKIEIF